MDVQQLIFHLGIGGGLMAAIILGIDDMSTERKNITQPADWWQAFERQAKREGLTLSEWIGECCRANVEEELSERPKAHRPRMPEK